MSPATRVPIWARNSVGNNIQSVPQTFSSWNNCMAKAYCKWPAIVGIVIAGLILFSVLACVMNCLCCGIQCCTGFCSCLSCLSCCCPSGHHSSRGRVKYRDDPTYYESPPPRQANADYQPPVPAPPMYRGPNTTQFDRLRQGRSTRQEGPKMDEDALPPMPSWENAITRKVEDTSVYEGDVEMTPLSPQRQREDQMQAAPRRNGAGYSDLHSPPAPRQRAEYEHPENRAYFNVPRAGLDDPMARNRGYRSAYDRSHQNHPPPAAPMQPQPPVFNPPQSQPPQQQSMYPSGPWMVAPSAVPSAEIPDPADFQRPLIHPSSPPPTYVSEYQEPKYPASEPVYHAYPPSHPASPPPSFSGIPSSQQNQPGRPPSLLQTGRKPVPHSWRDV